MVASYCEEMVLKSSMIGQLLPEIVQVKENLLEKSKAGGSGEALRAGLSSLFQQGIDVPLRARLDDDHCG
jgi:hypothetical protein